MPDGHPDALAAALRLSGRLLQDTPERLAHCRAAATHALETAGRLLHPADAETVAVAAMVHDIGYSPQVIRTGYHPLDGALHLARLGWPDRVVQLVAQHSHAAVLAPHHGVETHLSLIGDPPRALADVLTYSDLRAGFDGRGATVDERIADMRVRHAARDRGVVPEPVREHRYGLLRATAARVAEALEAARQAP